MEMLLLMKLIKVQMKYYDAKTKNKNMIEAGIIDPKKLQE